MAIDHVCGMEVDEKTSKFKSKVVGGKEIYFCCQHCKSRFDKQPTKFNV
jgi:YHS domain-containing protein